MEDGSRWKEMKIPSKWKQFGYHGRQRLAVECGNSIFSHFCVLLIIFCEYTMLLLPTTTLSGYIKYIKSDVYLGPGPKMI